MRLRARLRTRVADFASHESGATAIEYAIIAGSIAVILIGLAAIGGVLDTDYFAKFASHFS